MSKIATIPEIKYPSKKDLDLLYTLIPDGYKLHYNGNIAVICAAFLGGIRACMEEIKQLRMEHGSIVHVHGNMTEHERLQEYYTTNKYND